MKHVKVSAPGKLHLLGEHVVVHGKPAILAAVSKKCFVEIIPAEKKRIKISSKNYKKEIEISFSDLDKNFKIAQKDWEIYNETNDISKLKSITLDPLDYSKIVIGEFFNFHNIHLTDGLDIYVDSEIPEGCGMGSSGALAVSIIGALSLSTNNSFDKKTINEIAFLAEQKKHGKPSGGDNSTSSFGGLVWYRKDQGIKPLKFGVNPDIGKNFYIINTGTPKETTGEMVSLVKNLVAEKELFTKEIFDKQEELVKDLYLALEKNIPRQIPGILKMGESNLEKLGVVSSYVKKIIRDIESSGGAAKICGGGGITKATGIVLIYHTDLKKLKKALVLYKLTPTQLRLGVEGLKKE